MSFNPLVDQLAIEVNTAAVGRASACFPKIGHDRLASRKPLECRAKEREILCADVFAKSKQRVMRAQIIDGRSLALIDFDLLNARITLDVEDSVASPAGRH